LVWRGFAPFPCEAGHHQNCAEHKSSEEDLVQELRRHSKDQWKTQQLEEYERESLSSGIGRVTAPDEKNGQERPALSVAVRSQIAARRFLISAPAGSGTGSVIHSHVTGRNDF